MNIGIVGAGFIGRALARVAVANGHKVVISNSRDPKTLAATAIALHCKAGTVAEAVQFGDVVIVSIPFSAITQLEPSYFENKIVIDTNNYYPARDGKIEVLDNLQATTSGMLAEHLKGAKVVKAFNAILQDDIEKDAKPVGALGRRALPIAGNDIVAKSIVAKLVSEFGFDPFDAGDLSASWRFERAMPAYCVPLSLNDLKAAIASAERGVEVPDGAWRNRRNLAHKTNTNSKRHPIGFTGRGELDIVDAQFHIGIDHGIERSLAAMDALGIKAAMVDEFWSFDESFKPLPFEPIKGGGFRPVSPLATAASIQHSDRFAFIQRIELNDPALGSLLEVLSNTPGCKCLRLNLSKDQFVPLILDGTFDWIFELIQRKEFPMSILSTESSALVAYLAPKFTGIPLIVDHCGWIRNESDWNSVLELSRFSNVYLKWSHWLKSFRFNPNPVEAARVALHEAVTRFGASRIMWASDVSFEESKSSWYDLLCFIRQDQGISEEDRAWILGRTARSVHKLGV